jgi:hypothetical protein
MGAETWERWTPEKAADRPDLARIVGGFDAGASHAAARQAAEWLREHALGNHPSTITWLRLVDGELTGYFALASASVDLRQRDRRRLRVDASRPVHSASLIAQIARATDAPAGTGERLVEQAWAFAQEATQLQGSVALVADPFDDETARMWRERFGFRSSQTTVNGRRRLWIPLFG